MCSFFSSAQNVRMNWNCNQVRVMSQSANLTTPVDQHALPNSKFTSKLFRYLDDFKNAIVKGDSREVELTPPAVMFLNGLAHPTFGKRPVLGEFFRKLRHVKISPEAGEVLGNHQQAALINLPIGFVSVCSITRLVLSDLRIFINLATPGLAEHLIDLTVTNCTVPSLEAYLGSTQRLVWKRLKTLRCTKCGVSTIGPGIFEAALFPKLQYLDLSSNDIQVIENVEERPLDTLILNNNKIRECYMYFSTNLKNLFVDENSIESLSGFQAMGGLECLSARKNLISALRKEQQSFRLMHNLSELDLSENGVCEKDNFRIELISYLPTLDENMEFTLNEEDVSRREIGEAMKMKLSRHDTDDGDEYLLSEIDEKRESNLKTRTELVDSWKRQTYIYSLMPRLRTENGYSKFISELVMRVMNRRLNRVQQDVRTIVQLRQLCNIKVGYELLSVEESKNTDVERFHINLGDVENNIRMDAAIDTAIMSLIDDRKAIHNFSINFIDAFSSHYKDRVMRLVLPVDTDSVKSMIHVIRDALIANRELMMEPSVRKDGRTLFMKEIINHILTIQRYVSSGIDYKEYVSAKTVITKRLEEQKPAQFMQYERQRRDRENPLLLKRQGPKRVGASEEDPEETASTSKQETAPVTEVPEEKKSDKPTSVMDALAELDAPVPKITRRPGRGGRSKPQKVDEPEKKPDEPFKPIDLKLNGGLDSEDLKADVAPTVHRRAARKKGTRHAATKNALKVGTKELKDEDVVHLPPVEDSTPSTQEGAKEGAPSTGDGSESSEPAPAKRVRKVMGQGLGMNVNAELMAKLASRK